MGEDDRLDVIETTQDGREIRQDQVDAGLIGGIWKQHSTVDDEQLAIELENRHVPANGAQAAQGRHP
jgi:hypothetical protein